MGNIFIGVQPSFGYEGDPMRLLFSKSASPHHGFAAYYTYVDKVFDADAVLHFGTHGSLEFMPGKQVGMSGTCYPDRLISQTPNIYYYAANNPSEATIAKRRSYASTVSYLTPPAENAGLYKGLKDLGELVSSYQTLRENEQRGAAIVNSIVSSARTCNLDKDIKDLPTEEQNAKTFTLEERDNVVGKVYRRLMEIESRLLPCGLHTIGVPPTAEEAIATLVNIAGIDRPEDSIRSLPRLIAESLGRDIEQLYRSANAGKLEVRTTGEGDWLARGKRENKDGSQAPLNFHSIFAFSPAKSTRMMTNISLSPPPHPSTPPLPGRRPPPKNHRSQSRRRAPARGRLDQQRRPGDRGRSVHEAAGRLHGRPDGRQSDEEGSE